MLRKVWIELLLVHYISPVNGLAIDWIVIDQQSIKVLNWSDLFENFPLHWYKTDLRVIKSNMYSSHLDLIVTLQIIELYKNWLSYDTEVVCTLLSIPILVFTVKFNETNFLTKKFFFHWLNVKIVHQRIAHFNETSHVIAQLILIISKIKQWNLLII